MDERIARGGVVATANVSDEALGEQLLRRFSRSIGAAGKSEYGNRLRCSCDVARIQEAENIPDVVEPRLVLAELGLRLRQNKYRYATCAGPAGKGGDTKICDTVAAR